MDAHFWHERWESNTIGFHEGKPNELLATHFDTLAVPQGGRVFVPLCGKTRDIHWLLSQGYRVAGAELSERAVVQLFQELGFEPGIDVRGATTHYYAENLDVYVGDIFDLSPEILGRVDAIYDRAALVALPEAMRKAYRAHLHTLCGSAPQLLLTLEYEAGLIPGPPFSIAEEEVHGHYGSAYAVRAIESQYVPDGLQGKYPVTERAWILDRKMERIDSIS